MSSAAACERVRHLLGASIGQRILDSENPLMAFRQFCNCGELPVGQRLAEEETERRKARATRHCAVCRSPQIARGGTQPR
jgi:hypothetical protein